MDIKNLREQINSIDSELVSLFCKRMDISLEVARYKKERGLPVLDKVRERELLAKVSDMSSENFQTYTLSLYNTILNLSRSYQHQLINESGSISKMIAKALEDTEKSFPQRAVVACQGVSGAYSERAGEKLFATPTIEFYSSFEDVFKAVRDSKCDYGVLPIENSTAGSVNQVYDLMKKNKFFIAKSTRLKIDHCLLAKKGAEISNIKEVFSHEQAINQCSEFLRKYNIKTTVCENTAKAAEFVAGLNRDDVAAISSIDCANLYGLDVLCEDIQDSQNNYTRFICISKNLQIYPGASKTSFMMSMPHKAGALYGVLSRFHALGINLTKLESRPLTDRDFEFMFYFDVDCSVYSKQITQLIDELENESFSFSYLGSYSEEV